MAIKNKYSFLLIVFLVFCALIYELDFLSRIRVRSVSREIGDLADEAARKGGSFELNISNILRGGRTAYIVPAYISEQEIVSKVGGQDGNLLRYFANDEQDNFVVVDQGKFLSWPLVVNSLCDFSSVIGPMDGEHSLIVGKWTPAPRGLVFDIQTDTVICP